MRALVGCSVTDPLGPLPRERTTICSDLGFKFSISLRQILCSSEDCGLGHVRERGVTAPFTSCDAGFAHTTFHQCQTSSSTSNLPPKLSSPLQKSHEKFSPKDFCLLRTVFFFNAIFTLPSQSTFDSTTNGASAFGHGSDSVTDHFTAGATS